MSPRPIIGMFNRAAMREDRYVGLHDTLHESVQAAEDVYHPMTAAVHRYRELKEMRPDSYSKEDEQIAEQMMALMRQQSFFINRMKRILERGQS